MKDAVHQPIPLVSSKLDMLQPSAHHCAAPPMPKVLGFGAHEPHTSFDDVRLFAKQGICQSSYLNLRHRLKLCELHERGLHDAQRRVERPAKRRREATLLDR